MNSSDYYWRLRELAVSARTTVTDLCRAAGVNRATVTRWRSGSMPNMRTWQRVVDAAETLKERGHS